MIRHMRHLSPEIEGMGPKNPGFFCKKESPGFQGLHVQFPCSIFSFHVDIFVEQLSHVKQENLFVRTQTD